MKSLLERGRDLHRSGRLEEAEAVYGDVLRGSPDEFDALYAVAIIAAQKGRLDRAEELIAKALAVSPDHAEAQFNRGGLLFHLKRLDEALESFDSVVALEPGFAPAHFSRGLVLHRLGRAEQALESYDRSIGLAPDLAEAYLERANAQKDLGRFDDALASIDAFIGRKPGQAVAHNNRANLLKELGRDQEALADYDRAIALAPDDASAHYNRGNLLKDLDRPEEALEAYDRVIELNPDDPMTHNNRGNVLRELMRPDDAVASYRRAIALDPDHVQAHYNLSHCCLAMGDYATGWKEYEWRWREAQQAHRRRDFEQPLWLGGDGLEGKTILLHAEQGLGDTLQFCRYAKSVADRGARVLLEVPGPLMGVLGGLDGPDRLIAKGEPLPAFDCHCPLLSLPLAFATTVETIPAPRTYIAADPDRVAAWRDRLGAKDMPRVGLAWRGNPENGSDSSRSMGLALMSRLCTAGITWFSLHNDLLEGEAEVLAAHPEIQHFGEEMNFVETAALIEHLDLVVSVDTAIAHLAGALGREVWIPLRYKPDWRWLLGREDSPWYPSARLFRQKTRGAWEGVLDEISRALRARFRPGTQARRR